jgi:hypothetical protein
MFQIWQKANKVKYLSIAISWTCHPERKQIWSINYANDFKIEYEMKIFQISKIWWWKIILTYSKKAFTCDNFLWRNSSSWRALKMVSHSHGFDWKPINIFKFNLKKIKGTYIQRKFLLLVGTNEIPCQKRVCPSHSSLWFDPLD